MFKITLLYPKTWTQSSETNPDSLVPRPFPPPVFDRLQYAKTGNKYWRWEWPGNEATTHKHWARD